MEQVEVRKRGRDESEIDSPEVKRIREDLFEGLDEDPDFCTSIQDLDSFMKSFEDEITASVSPASGELENGVVDLTSDSGDSRPDLGYLLEASDDELGIPPPTASPSGNELSAELVTVDSDLAELIGEFWEASDYDTFGIGETENYGGEYVVVDGLFDYWDMGFGSGHVET